MTEQQSQAWAKWNEALKSLDVIPVRAVSGGKWIKCFGVMKGSELILQAMTRLGLVGVVAVVRPDGTQPEAQSMTRALTRLRDNQ